MASTWRGFRPWERADGQMGLTLDGVLREQGMARCIRTCLPAVLPAGCISVNGGRTAGRDTLLVEVQSPPAGWRASSGGFHRIGV